MTCSGARELIPLAAGGDLAPERATEVRDHAAGCADCAAELEKFEQGRELVRGLRAPELSREQAREMWAGIRREVPMSPREAKFGALALLKLAGVLLVGACVGYTAYGISSVAAPLESAPLAEAPGKLVPILPVSTIERPPAVSPSMIEEIYRLRLYVAELERRLGQK